MNFLLIIAGIWFLFWLGATIVEKYQQGVRDRAAHAALDNNFNYEILKQEIVAVNERAGFVKGRNTCLGCGGTLVMRTSLLGASGAVPSIRCVGTLKKSWRPAKMAYYEQKKRELEQLLSLLKTEKGNFETSAAYETTKINEKIAYDEKLKIGVVEMAKERQIGFPWLAKAYDELFHLEEYKDVSYLQRKKRPAMETAEIVKEWSRLRRQAEKEKRVAQYIVNYYETIAPFLLDFKHEVDIGTEEERALLKEYSEEELQDGATHFLAKEEYRKLPSVERNQLALDRFWQRPMSKWMLGRLYERYVGFLFESEGYDVDYVGIFKGYEDLGRDLICKKGNDFVVIQCKNWSQFKTIYEKHIFQFFGTVFQYKDANPKNQVRAVFYTTTHLSDLARRFAQELKIELKEGFKFDKKYPCIKCNISGIDGSKIYHLPFDQQYDTTRIEKSKGEFYCATIKGAEDAGFRRAYRWRPQKDIAT
jgi:hypothetical protein